MKYPGSNMRVSSLLSAAAMAGTLALASPLAPAPAELAASPSSTSSSSSSLDKRDFDFEEFVRVIAETFPVNVTLQAGCELLTAAQQEVAELFDISTSGTDVDDGVCADVTLIFARGTCDPGNLGAITAPPFIEALLMRLGDRSLGVQGVPYPATVDGYLNEDTEGGDLMADIVTQTRGACPDTQIVMGGYSQGGFAVHYAAEALGDAMADVSSVVVFGDPASDEAVAGIDAGRVSIVCNDGDDICDNGVLILLPHLTYALDALSAAGFVVDNLA